jgi:RNA polymerase sigma-70 factor (ECF subfamily)
MSNETFAALLGPNLESVQKFVQRRLKAVDQAEDVVQETLLHAFHRRSQLRAPSKFKSWLYSIALNEIRMLYRKDRKHLSLDEFPTLEFRDHEPSPLERVEQTKRVDWLHSAMAKLSTRDRTTIRLRDLEERSLTESAALLRSSEAATKTAHFRARHRLGTALRQTA